VQIDATTNSLMIIAEEQAMARFVAIINQLEKAIGPGQEVRLTPLEYATASDVVDFLRNLTESSESFRATTPGPDPMFEPIERTNSVLIAAQPLQHGIIQSLIRELDVREGEELPPVRILQIESADAANLASTLNRVYAGRPAEQRAEKPVNITADPNTNSLLVSAHPEPFTEIEKIVSDLNEKQAHARTGREIRIFPLKIARAEDLAKTLDQMFPEPPIPVDGRGRPLPHLRQPREVVVRGDAQTNSIIVDAPVERMASFDELVKQLDTAEMPTEAELRTYPITYADLNAVRTTLQQLVRDGALMPRNTTKRVNPRSR
jgi:general secretion pathway protein D